MVRRAAIQLTKYVTQEPSALRERDQQGGTSTCRTAGGQSRAVPRMQGAVGVGVQYRVQNVEENDCVSELLAVSAATYVVHGGESGQEELSARRWNSSVVRCARRRRAQAVE